MKISPVVAGLTVAGLATAMTVTGTVGANAATTFSEISIDPIEPSTAAVCWTPYEPDGGAEVTRYRLTTTPGTETFLFPDEDPPGPDGRFCVTDTNFKSAKKYTFTLAAKVGTDPYVPATLPESLETTPYSLSASYSRTTAKAGQKVTVSGVLKSAGTSVPDATVVVQQKLRTSDEWSQLGGPLTTGKNGQYAKSFTVKENASVRTYFGGIEDGDETVGAWNSATRIDVSPVFSLSFSKNPVKLGKAVTARGEVTDGELDALAGDNVCLQKKQGGSWGAGVCVPIGDDGRFQTKITPTSKKDLSYRWWASSVAPEYVAGGSPPKRLTVK